MSERIARIALLFFFLLGLLAVRLAVLMVSPAAVISKPLPHAPRIQAELEHLHVLRVDDGRGRILYRNGLPWSGTVQPSEASPQRTQSRNPSARDTPFLVHSERTGVFAHPSVVVGRVGLPDVWPNRLRTVPEQGRTGLEYTFDFLLRQGRPAYVGSMDPANGTSGSKRIFWLPVKPGIDIRTTIDPAWQSAVETSMSQHHIHTGAVVVLNAKNRDVLAMASRNGKSPQTNEAIKAHTPGSIFKIVTAAASLESYRNSPQDAFYCGGELQQPGITLKCWRKHGRETLLQAFAGSCNVVFAQLGLNAGEKALSFTAQRFGLTGTGLQTLQGHSVLPEADAGKIFMDDKHRPSDRGMIAHTAIGQQDVKLSPLQGANLAATIAAGGMYQDARLVLDGERRHKAKRYFGRLKSWTAVSHGTAAWLGEAMHMTAHWQKGTAFDLVHDESDPAVKTGTAEVHDAKINAWMVGYAPYRSPQIAFCVFVGPGSSRVSHQQVHALTKDLLRSYRQFQKRHVIG